MDITPFRNIALMLQKDINQLLLSLAGEMYRVKQIEDRLKELELNSTQFQRRLSDAVELVKNQLAWIETHSTFPANMPQKYAGSLKMEVSILNFGCRTAVKLNTAIEKTIEKCAEFYKGIHVVQNQWMILTDSLDQVFPVREEYPKNFKERLQKGEENISRLNNVSEEDIKIWIIQASGHKLKLEESLSQSTPQMKEIESQLSKHEVAVRVLEPVEFQVINEQAQAWDVFVKTPDRPT